VTARIAIGPSVKPYVDWVIREYIEGNRLHFYNKSELADPTIQWLVPWCQADDMYPARHPKVEVKADPVAAHVRACVGCANADRRARGDRP
jgi:hypothetical protein